MAISTQRSLKELKKECDRYGLVVTQSGNRESKTDYVLALREYYLQTLYPNGVPATLDLMLQIESPMLCNRFSNLKPEQQEAIWNSDEWYLETKEDGCRMLIVKVGNDWQFFSRNISVKDFLPVSYSGHILENWDHEGIDHDFILDCELVSLDNQVSTILGKRGLVTTTQLQAVTALLALNSEDTLSIQKGLVTEDGTPVLQFRCFDCLWSDGEWHLEKALIDRKKYTYQFIDILKSKGMNIRKPYSNISNKRAFYKAIIANGGEGCVAKNIYSPYIASSNRPAYGWVKIKRSMSETQQMMGLADTVDAFVTGFEPADPNKSWAGLVGALEFSVFLEDENGERKQHKIARITNLTMELREQMTKIVDGEPVLKEEWYGKCASIDGVCVSGRAKRLKHARLIDWRPDRSPDTCIMTEEFLNSMIL